MTNVTTPGYKRRIAFSKLMATQHASSSGPPTTRFRFDFSQGKLTATGNPLDIAIDSAGFFLLRDGETTFYSRQGQFSRNGDGALVNAQGHVLQQAGGGDVVVDHADVTIEDDGTVLDAGRPVARIGVFAPTAATAMHALDGSAFELSAGQATEVANPALRQGMLEASNVSIGDEMVTMMAALRQAESGSRLVQTYDDLLGRAITAFGPGGQ